MTGKKSPLSALFGNDLREMIAGTPVQAIEFRRMLLARLRVLGRGSAGRFA